MTDFLVLAGLKLQPLADNNIPKDKRAMIRTQRPSSQTDPAIIRRADWNMATPMGLTKETDRLGTDWTTLDHRWGRLTSPAKRNTTTLTAPSALIVYKVPASDVTKTNWTDQAAGTTNLYTKIDAGIYGGTPDDTDYCKTSTVGSPLIVGMGTSADPGVNTGFYINVRWKSNSTGSPKGRVRLYASTTVVWESDDQVLTTAFTTVQIPIPEASVANLVAGDFSTANQLRCAVVAQTMASGELDVSELELQFPDNETSGNVIYIEEDRGQIFVHRGRTSTQVNPATMAEVAHTDHSYSIVGNAQALNKGLVSFGTLAQVQQRTAVSATTASYSGVTKKAYHMKQARGTLFYVDGDDSTPGAVRYTLDAFTSVSDPITAGDASVASTGMGAYGPYALVGRENSLSSFTDSGKSMSLDNEEMLAFRSSINGSGMAEFAGWEYVTSKMGLRCTQPGLLWNKAGLTSIEGYEGGISGYPVALFHFKGRLLCALLTDFINPTTATLTIIYGEYIKGGATDATGELAWYFFDQQTGVDCRAFGMTSGRENPTLIRGENQNICWYTLGRMDRDILDSAYRYSVSGGTWTGTETLNRNELLTPIAYQVVSHEADRFNKWQLSISQNGGDYVDFGEPVTSSGFQQITADLSRVTTGTTIKPRWTQTAGSSTNPTWLEPTLSIDYLSRPAMVEEAAIPVQMNASQWAQVMELRVPETDKGTLPIEIQMPGETKKRFGFVTGLDAWQDFAGDKTMAATVRVILW